MIIYKITNSKNNKVYIGQTTRRLSERISDYKSEIKHGLDRYIIRSMRKHGFDSFTFEVLYEGNCSPDELTALENKYIDEYKSYDKGIGYNLKRAACHGGHSEETKRKIGEAQLGTLNHMYGIKGKDHHSSKLTIELTTGLKFDSITEASEYFKVSLHHASGVCRGQRGSVNGRVFRYITDGEIYLNKDRVKIRLKSILNSIREEFKDYI